MGSVLNWQIFLGDGETGNCRREHVKFSKYANFTPSKLFLKILISVSKNAKFDADFDFAERKLLKAYKNYWHESVGMKGFFTI